MARMSAPTGSKPNFWLRRTAVVLLSPIGLLLISATRLLIISDYNTTTATTIAASGGYVDTVLGTAMPLVPIFLPYLALALLLFKRFILSALAFGAALLVSPTRLAPLTALNTLDTEWSHAIKLLERNLLIAIPVFIIVLAIDIFLFIHFYGTSGVVTLALAVAATIFLAPYIFFVYPFPHGPDYYEALMRQPWLPPEQIELKSGDETTGYVLSSDIDWTVVLDAASRTIQYISTEDITGRLVCQTGQVNKITPLIRLLHAPRAQLPACGRASPLAEPLGGGRQSRQWTANVAVTSSKRFQPLPGLSNLHICADNQALALLSVKLAGATAGFRVEVDRSGSMDPGPVRFTPKGKHDSFSLAFIRRLPGPSADHRHTFNVEWRSPTGGLVELRHATFGLDYRAQLAGC
jgi:hypothetical protein